MFPPPPDQFSHCPWALTLLWVALPIYFRLFSLSKRRLSANTTNATAAHPPPASHTATKTAPNPRPGPLGPLWLLRTSKCTNSVGHSSQRWGQCVCVSPEVPILTNVTCLPDFLFCSCRKTPAQLEFFYFNSAAATASCHKVSTLGWWAELYPSVAQIPQKLPTVNPHTQRRTRKKKNRVEKVQV